MHVVSSICLIIFLLLQDRYVGLRSTHGFGVPVESGFGNNVDGRPGVQHSFLENC